MGASQPRPREGEGVLGPLQGRGTLWPGFNLSESGIRSSRAELWPPLPGLRSEPPPASVAPPCKAESSVSHLSCPSAPGSVSQEDMLENWRVQRNQGVSLRISGFRALSGSAVSRPSLLLALVAPPPPGALQPMEDESLGCLSPSVTCVINPWYQIPFV